MHITSLPSRFAIGDLGPEAYKFADFLKKAGQKFWQLLPLNPPARSSYSPYNCNSAFAGNFLLISPELLYQQGLLKKKEISKRLGSKSSNVCYKIAKAYKKKLFKIAFHRFQNTASRYEYEQFCSNNVHWLNDYAIFSALSKAFSEKLWCDWPIKCRDRDKSVIESKKRLLAEHIDYEKFLQYLFFKQWRQLKKYCNDMGIRIIGDIPVYVALNSADVWSHPEWFKLNKSKRPKFISGVPPDLFSSTGQLWNNPIYDWTKLKKQDFQWWIRRIHHNLDVFDIVRIDHFRGFVAYWQLPAGSKTAVNGKWIKGPAENFFKTLFKHVNPNLIIAEDLGYITKSVRKYIQKYRLTGMRVLQFGFGNEFSLSPHFPENLKANCIVYTGTHDNNTIKGWFEKETTQQTRKRLFNCLGRKVSSNQIHWQLVRLAMSSAARLAIIPVQDILGLGHESRMNHPGKTKGNWQWKLKKGQLTTRLASKLYNITRQNGRC